MRVNDGTTHWFGCEQEHHACALAELARLRERLDRAEAVIAAAEKVCGDRPRYTDFDELHAAVRALSRQRAALAAYDAARAKERADG